jgi:hypothetical protein
VAVHKEPGGHDVELLADVLAHAHHRLTTAAGGAFGLVTVFDARQVLRQGLAFGLAPVLSHWPAEPKRLCYPVVK